MYLSDKTSQAIDAVVGLAFDCNRTFDRAVSVMANKWSMPQASDIIHHNLAHLFPLLADVLTDFKSEWNVASVYPATHEDGRDYRDLLDMMGTLLKETEDFYEATKMAYVVASEEGDLNAVAMFTKFIRMLTVVMGQVITLRDKAEQMPTGYDNYDRHISSWKIDGLDIEKF